VSARSYDSDEHITEQAGCWGYYGIAKMGPPGASVRPATPGLVVTRVLVVDDDPIVCKAIEVLLQRHGFEVIVADGGEAGLRALDGGGIDLMIVDVFMPHMRGFESIRIFHERAPAIPLVAISGYAFANLNKPAPDFLRMALELGASRCLRKPFTPDALLAIINDCLAEVQASAPGLVQSK
jgi:CheY-like chemotaxis protein